MFDRPFQHVADRDQECQEDEEEERQHQKEGAALGPRLRGGQCGLQRSAVGGGQKFWGCFGHACAGTVPRARHLDYWASQAWKRSFSSESWSTQKSAEVSSAFTMFSGAVGRCGAITVLPSL